MSERVTMKQIAAQSGVTQATVSLCLANHPRIPEPTRLRVQAVALKMGYRVNPYVAALMRSRRQGRPLPDRPVLAIVCAYDTPHGWRDSASHTVRQIHAGAMAQAAVRGYQGRDVWLHQDGMSSERFSEILHVRGIQGVLLGPPLEGGPLPDLRWDYFSVVRIGVPKPVPPLPSVCHDNYFASMTAVHECHRLGYRRPGLVLLRAQNLRLQRRWEAGFLAALRDLPDTASLAPLLLDDWSNLATFCAWLRTKKPDVIITSRHAEIARHLATLKLKVPGDLGLASLTCEEADGRISGIYENGRLIGANAIDLLVSRVEHNTYGLPAQATTLMVEGQWNPGATLRRHKPR
jgi:DNA-binding LacI/PurR family transcriptional regulator